MVPLGFFRSPPVHGGELGRLLVGFALFGSLYFITLYFQNIKGYSPLEAGVRSMPMTLIILFVAPLAGRLERQGRPAAVMTVGMLLGDDRHAGLAQLTSPSSYNAMWPFFSCSARHLADDAALSGAGDGRRRPASRASPRASSTRHGRSAARSASRLMGSIVAKLAADDFGDARRSCGSSSSAGRPGSSESSPALRQARAADAFMTGMHGAIWAGAAMTLIAAAVSCFGCAPAPRSRTATRRASAEVWGPRRRRPQGRREASRVRSPPAAGQAAHQTAVAAQRDRALSHRWTPAALARPRSAAVAAAVREHAPASAHAEHHLAAGETADPGRAGRAAGSAGSACHAFPLAAPPRRFAPGPRATTPRHQVAAGVLRSAEPALVPPAGPSDVEPRGPSRLSPADLPPSANTAASRPSLAGRRGRRRRRFPARSRSASRASRRRRRAAGCRGTPRPSRH